MSKRKHIPRERINETVAKWPNIDRTCNDSISVIIETEYYRFSKFTLCMNISGNDLSDRYGDDDLEYYITVKKEQIPKLASKFSALDAPTLAKRIAERFAPYGRNALDKFRKFLDEKGIEYKFSMY